MFEVKAVDPAGRAVTFACGTAEQALERGEELEACGFKDVKVTDLKGEMRSLAKFARLLES